MSNVNIRRAVENIKSGTTVYTPIVETIVNAIQAIDNKKEKSGVVTIIVERSGQIDLEDTIPNVKKFIVIDNGIGFTDENRESFDTLYSDQKINEGGKGFGRFTCLKYFENLNIESIFKDGEVFKQRSFLMGKNNDIIVNEKVSTTEKTEPGSIVELQSVKNGKFPDKKLTTIARNLTEKLLPYFVSKNYLCPQIILSEKIGSDSIILNNYVNNELSGLIKEIVVPENDFVIKVISDDYHFKVRVFKFYSPKSQKSKISLVAHRREVTNTSIHNYIPEFVDEFYDKQTDSKDRNFIVKAYVFGDYLDKNVSLERGGFDFHKENELLLGISQNEIEVLASEIAKRAVGDDITLRQDKKNQRIKSYVQESAPWHRELVEEIDFSDMPFKPSNEQIESRLQKEKYNREVIVKREVNELLSNSDTENLKENVAEVVRKISGTSKNDLVHYAALRRNVLDIFERSLEISADGSYSSEGVVHDIIFPRKGDINQTSFEGHNLWIIDERLNFTEYVCSDLSLNGGHSGRPDLLVYDEPVLFRGDNEASNPITVFEFKKPQRDDFVNPSSKEDPVEQIIRYVNKIRDGEYKTPEGREILVTENTPFYGYVVCALTKKVKRWLETEKDFKPMPDRLGFFQWRENINLYIEVLSWDKVLKDANMRNKIFFHKLGI